MNVYVIIAIIFTVVGTIGGAYYKGEKSCSNSYQVKILKAQLKNKEIALSYYKSAKIASEKISGEAKKEAIANEEQGKKIDAIINEITSNNSCIDDGFVRSLERIR